VDGRTANGAGQQVGDALLKNLVLRQTDRTRSRIIAYYI
jgi:hypothetical protein